MPNTNKEETYKITLLNAPVGAAYSVYFDSTNTMAGVGSITSNPYAIAISSDFVGPGKIKFMVRNKTRTSNGYAFSVPFESEGKDLEITVPQQATPGITIPSPKSSPQKSTDGGIKLITNKLQEAVQNKKNEQGGDSQTQSADNPPRKKFLQNKLMQKVQDKKSDTEDSIDSRSNVENNEPSTSKKSFWDKLK